MQAARAERHRHGPVEHAHAHTSRHRHLTAPWLSSPAPARARRANEHPRHKCYGRDEEVHGVHGHGHGVDGHGHVVDGHGAHGHSHGRIDESIKRSQAGIRAVSLSLLVLGIAAVAQTAIYVLSGSIALLADLIHNFGDALTAVPLGIAFASRSDLMERRAGLAVVLAIFISACVAGVEAVNRILHPSAPTNLLVLGLAGAIGYLGNYIAARIRVGAGRRLDSPALIADGHHARADAYVSLAVVGSALLVAAGLPRADPIIGLAITLVILRITWQSWRTITAAG
jgi:Co/Zn/Cd efflux system component